MDIAAEAQAGTKAIKQNWLFFALVGAGAVVLVLWWDHKKGGKVTAWLASKPVVGKLFA